MIQVAAFRNKIELEKKEGSTEAEIILLKEDHLYTFPTDSTTITLKEVRELEKKPYLGFTMVGQITGPGHVSQKTSHHGWTRTTSVGGPKDSAIINLGWTASTAKADKEIRGKEIKLSHYYEIAAGPSSFYVIVGHLPDKFGLRGERILIYAKTYGEYKMWRSRVDHPSGAKYILGARPRVLKSALWRKDYAISAEHVKRIEVEEVEELFTGPDGDKLSKTEFLQVLKEVSRDCGCTGCGNPLFPEDADDLMWFENVIVLCSNCQEDPTIMDYLGAHKKGAA